MFNLIDQKIRKAFSNAAMQYDVLTGLHKEIGRELIARVALRDNCSAVLDVGMGPGWLTNRLTRVFENAGTVGVDFSLGMIGEAKKKEGSFKIVQAHAENLPFKDSTFDVVVSNLAYQWVDDLLRAFKQCYLVLKDDGLFCCTLFGRNTFEELFISLESATDRNVLPIDRLTGQEEISRAVCEAGFSDIKINSELIKARFPGMMALLKWIKDIGANALPRDFFVGKELLSRANEYYEQNFRDRLGVIVTFEVIWVEVKR